MSDEHKKIARKFLEDGWNKGKEKAIDELMSPKCRFHDPVFPSLTSGMENYKEHIRNFPDLKFTIEDSIAERNEVVHHWKALARIAGRFWACLRRTKARPFPARRSTAWNEERLRRFGWTGIC